MKCLACDDVLTDTEAVRKAPSGFYLELCDPCLEWVKEDIYSDIPRDNKEVKITSRRKVK